MSRNVKSAIVVVVFLLAYGLCLPLQASHAQAQAKFSTGFLLVNTSPAGCGIAQLPFTAPTVIQSVSASCASVTGSVRLSIVGSDNNDDRAIWPVTAASGNVFAIAPMQEFIITPPVPVLQEFSNGFPTGTSARVRICPVAPSSSIECEITVVYSQP